MSHAGIYNGPTRYIKKYNQTVPRKGPEILSATLTLGEHTYELEQNSINIVKKEDGLVYIYHIYDYHNESGKRAWGRWYDAQIPIAKLQGLPADNTFEYTMSYYENAGPAVFRVTFAPRAAARLRAAA